MSPSTHYFAISLRVLIALCTRTVFQPDEYFQALEPAHHAVFGYGHLTWEWMAPKPIRSILYPALNVPIYWILKVTGLAETSVWGDMLLIACPKILHGFFAAGADIYVAETTRRTLGSTYVSTAFLLSLTSFFNSLALSRSLSNSLETTLTTIAFSYYPWDASSSLSSQLIFNRARLRKLILFSAFACMVRPTNAVIWLFLYGKLFWAIRRHHKVFLVISQDICTIGVSSFGFLVALDSLYYGKLTFTPINFLKTNLSSVSLFYGANPWHYYFTQGIPILCSTALPFTLHGIWNTIESKSAHNTAPKTMLGAVLWSVGVYSLGGHKEWRFLHPILPLLQIFAAKSLVDLSLNSRSKLVASAKGNGFKKPSTKPTRRTFIHRVFDLPSLPISFLILLLSSLPISLYIVLFYCSAPISVLSYIRSIPREELGNSTVAFLMPCHSTPGYTYLHRDQLAHGGMWALGCEPPLEQQALAEYKDQTNVFFDAPKHYLETYFPKQVNPSFPPSPFPISIPGARAPIPSPTSERAELLYPWRHEWPRYLVFFGNLLRQDGVKSLLENQGYKKVWRAGREWEGEGERQGGVEVWKWTA